MPRTATDAEIAKARRLIENVCEPKIQAIIDQLNLVLSAHGIRAGAEVQWFIDGISDPTPKGSEHTDRP